MNGSRGAKGSIKDRLISMLYRFRYKKKKLKEENYTIPKKEKQLNYLNTLKEFKEKENINILDVTDVKVLNDVKLTATFKVDKKSIDNTNEKLNIKLINIEEKSSELTGKTDIKKEIKKTKNEIVILKEVEKFVNTSLEAIDEIKSDVKILKKESKEKNKDTKQIDEKYDKLKKKVEKLKLQFDTVKEKYDLSEFSILESIKLIENITSYKSLASLNELDMMLNVCKKEINKIESITLICEDKKTIGSNIETVKNDQKNIKIKFNKNKELLNSVSDIEKNIFQEIKEQQKIVDDMYEKASYYEKQISKKIETVGHRKILSSLFRIAGGILTIPFTGKNLFGIALGSTMINKGLKEMNKSLETKERIVINYKYEDISKQINDVKDKIEYINLILSDSLNQISKLRDNFNNEFKEYNNVLPEYFLMLESINSLENKLKEQQYKMNNVDKKLETEKEINKQKLKIVGKD